MSKLEDALKDILNQKNSYLTPENLKIGINCLGVSGTFTADADATAEDIRAGKIAYVNGEKIIGTM